MQEHELFTVDEVVKMLKVSRDTVSRRFENGPGVIDLGVPTRRYKRRNRMLRIPAAVLNRSPTRSEWVTQPREERVVWRFGCSDSVRSKFR